MYEETEVWFRNPDLYIRELVECGEYKIAWDRGLLVKKRIDPKKHADLYFGKTYPYRLLLVGEQGTAEIRSDSTVESPTAVYPTWVYGEDAALLEEIVARPVGEDRGLCSDRTVPPDERPVYGQEHRVVIIECPPISGGPGRKFIKYLKELQEDYPDCILHVHGLYSFRMAFGLGFGAADYEPRTLAAKGKVCLPSGSEVRFEKVGGNPKWITQLGFKPIDLSIPRNRCMYNIKSAVWAGQNYNKLYRFRTINDGRPADSETPTSEYQPREAGSYILGKAKDKPGDKFQCDTCSLQTDCKYYRAGAVCSVPGAEPTDLARFFKTRDSAMIIDGLGVLLAAQTRRLETGMMAEDDFGELSPEVTKILNSLFEQGVKLAKLVDPTLRSPKVQVNVGQGGAAAVGLTVTPQRLIGAAVRELEARGIPRDKITPEMIQGLLSGMADQENSRKAIEATVIENQSA